jgi:hypothetical protein
MTELRDARLRQALDRAPDAGLQPPARVRDAIRSAAHGAVQPAWRRWWPKAGERRTPWLAAFASVLVASLVVVIWQGQETPGARPEPQLADRQAPATVAVPAPAPAAEQAAPALAPAAAPPAAATRAPVVRSAPPPRARAAADALEARTRGSTEGRASTPLAQAPAAAPPPAGGAEAPQPAEALAKAAPPPPPAPMAAPAPAPAPAAAARFAAAPQPAWTQVRISAGGRSVLIPRSQADALPALIARMFAAPREPAAPAAASLRLELEAQGVLEWSEEGWRLLPQGNPQRAQLLRADEATSAALRAEAERLLGR